jgi:hypothetical protein
LGFLADSVLSGDFCFFSSRKRREIYRFITYSDGTTLINELLNSYSTGEAGERKETSIAIPVKTVKFSQRPSNRRGGTG